MLDGFQDISIMATGDGLTDVMFKQRHALRYFCGVSGDVVVIHAGLDVVGDVPLAVDLSGLGVVGTVAGHGCVVFY